MRINLHITDQEHIRYLTGLSKFERAAVIKLALRQFIGGGVVQGVVPAVVAVQPAEAPGVPEAKEEPVVVSEDIYGDFGG